MGAHGRMDRNSALKSKGLGFDSHCRSCKEVLGKLVITHCLGLSSSFGYLVHRFKVRSIVAGCQRRSLPGEVMGAAGNVIIHMYICSDLKTFTFTFTFSNCIHRQCCYKKVLEEDKSTVSWCVTSNTCENAYHACIFTGLFAPSKSNTSYWLFFSY